MTNTNKPNALRQTRLGCERLEHRDNPAGNMAAFFSGAGELVVLGDGLDNAVSIQQNAFADTIIYGVNGTTINGQSAIYVGRGALGGLRVDSGAGNDLIEVLGVQTPGIVSLWGGLGNDGINANGIVATGFGVGGSFGNDVITTTSVFVRSWAWVGGGPGFDVLDYNGISGPQQVVEFEAIV
ncbi:MAG TPA: hypothetical protein VM597_27910 [Gemmataceae bacterium]|jgi:hypothetical protein|nr:hypothetical protein [Gemmataceae bacterium]